MRLIVFAVALSACTSLAGAGETESVLLASRRAGWIEAISPETLATVSRVQVPGMAESIASDPSGQRLFVAFPSGPQKACCALFALDPQSMQMSFMLEPARFVTVTTGRLFTQRGNVGIEVFDPQSLLRLPTVKAPGIYRLQPSPDGRLLFGITNGPAPSLDLFDVQRAVRIGG
jgi:hypothetical protein